MAEISHVGKYEQSSASTELKLKLAEGLGCTPGSCHPAVSHHQSLSFFLRTTGVVNDQHDIDAIGLQQVHEKAPVSLGIQAHASGMLRC